ncbi:Dcm Site-specific DNA methylase [uncultured Caudovirales phage]|uniref:Cytosine-specific methyltransferase n=1 Tax=uncultured Caudovirales phage TaxID=2100421 RepID=A0A6J5MZ18_9CAUD|nr:Dcm Site-specific DNA methylase [uncultured Caudovirales phage]
MSHEQYPINLPEPQPKGKPLRYLSVCSGMEAASVAWHPLGWKPVGFSEIEPFPCAILKHRFPHIPNHGSLTEYKQWPLEPGAIDLLVGGTPCQSFSVAGLRKGLTDPRGNLALTFLGLADKLKPKWIIWENVPGVLSSGGGRDFGSFLGALVELGYGFAYRVLDAQHFGVPQRRRRVFVVACLGDWRAAAEVLSLGEGLSGYLASGGKKRKGVAADAGSGVDLKSQYFDFQAIGKYGNDGSASTLMARDYKDSKDLVVDPVAFTPSSFAQYSEGIGTIRANGGDLGGGSEGLVVSQNPHAVGQPLVIRESGQGFWMEDDKAGTLRAEGENRPSRPSHVIGQPIVPFGGAMPVRRLTPVECERLQGFPDNWSRISWKGKPEDQCPDGPRYKACGNSMAVPVMRWIGNRIAQHEAKA